MTSLGAQLSAGESADVYRWNDDQVIKLFRAGFPARLVEAEVRNAQYALSLKIPTPAPLETLMIQRRWGIIFQRVPGPTMMQVMIEDNGATRGLAALFAQLHGRLHSFRTDRFPSQRQRLRNCIEAGRYLDRQQRQICVHTLEKLTDDSCLCHGDFQPLNVVISDDGPVLLDWYDACSGNPLADVARSALLLEYSQLPASVPPNLHADVERVRLSFFNGYKNHYQLLHRVEWSEVEPWLLPVAAARLGEKISANEVAIMKGLVDRLIAEASQ